MRDQFGDHCNMNRKEFFYYLSMHSKHFIYGYVVSDIWLRTTERKPAAATSGVAISD